MPASDALTEQAPAGHLADYADRILEVVPRAMRRIRREMRAEPASGDRMTVPQLRALLYVRRHPDRSLSALADHLGMSLPACSALVERLVRAGRLSRTVDPTERRRVRLRLTSDGAERVARAHLRARSGSTASWPRFRPRTWNACRRRSSCWSG